MARKKTKRKQATTHHEVVGAVHTSLNQFLNGIKANAKAAAEAGEPKGACLINDPHTGQNHCILTDKTTCGKLKGVFIGGPCGG